VVECRGATRQAVENLVNLALVERLAFVVIVGDLYDGD
jgi:DNA repair protein SbcD/Mre11